MQLESPTRPSFEIVCKLQDVVFSQQLILSDFNEFELKSDYDFAVFRRFPAYDQHEPIYVNYQECYSLIEIIITNLKKYFPLLRMFFVTLNVPSSVSIPVSLLTNEVLLSIDSADEAMSFSDKGIPFVEIRCFLRRLSMEAGSNTLSLRFFHQERDAEALDELLTVLKHLKFDLEEFGESR